MAELIRLGAKTARTFADCTDNGNGQLFRVEDLSVRIEGLADELLGVAKTLEEAASHGR